MFRYDPGAPRAGWMWDRWVHRFCIAVPGQAEIVCPSQDQTSDAASRAPTTGIASVAPGLKNYQRLISGGYSRQEADKWKAERTQKLRSAGFTPREISDYWGE